MNSNHLATVIHSAAASDEERELIGAIAQDLSDMSAREAYCSWLEARDDPRQYVVREIAEFAEQVLRGDPGSAYLYSSLEGYSTSWLAMQGHSLLQMIREEPDLQAVAGVFLRHAVPTVDIRAEAVAPDSLSPFASRFGGRPCLPVDFVWPHSQDGMLGFLGQIALGDLRFTQAARVLPHDGWLSFFALNDHIGGNRGQDDAAVSFFSPESKLIPRDIPEGVELPYWKRSLCRLIFTETWDFPDGDDLVVSDDDRHRLDAAIPDFDFDDYRTPLRKGDSHLLGYGRHSRTSDPSPAADWRNLLCLGSTSALSWNWCDGEHLAYFIQQSELTARKFNRVFGYAS